MNTQHLSELVRQIENTPEYQFESIVVDLAEEICEIMSAQGLTRAELARRLGKSRAYVTKLLRGDQNLTLRTVVDVLFELGYKAEIRVTPATRKDTWDEVVCEFSSQMDVRVLRIPAQMLQRDDYAESDIRGTGEATNVVAA
jgi:transcriptional regulator with XRE-family HTH domain